MHRQCGVREWSSCLNALRKRWSSVEGCLENAPLNLKVLLKMGTLIISLPAVSLKELNFDWSIILCVLCPAVLIASAGQPGVCSALLGPTSVSTSLSCPAGDCQQRCCLRGGGGRVHGVSRLSGVRRLKKEGLGIIRGVQGRIFVDLQLNGDGLFWISCVYNQSLSTNVPLFIQLSCHHTWNLQPAARPLLPPPPLAAWLWPMTFWAAGPNTASPRGSCITPK